MSNKKKISRLRKVNFALHFISFGSVFKLFFSLGRTLFLLHGLAFICSSQSIKHQCLLGVSEPNQIKFEGYFVKEGKSVLRGQKSVQVALFCTLAKNFSIFIWFGSDIPSRYGSQSFRLFFDSEKNPKASDWPRQYCQCCHSGRTG